MPVSCKPEEFLWQQGARGRWRAVAAPFRIGVVVDMSGVYASNGGPGAVVAARMAVEDFGATVLGRPIEILSADYQNKAEIASAIARKWFDVDKVDMVIESTASAAALAIQKIGQEHKKIPISAGSVPGAAGPGRRDLRHLHGGRSMTNHSAPATCARNCLRSSFPSVVFGISCTNSTLCGFL